jgi:PST family polysaccharide transporter
MSADLVRVSLLNMVAMVFRVFSGWISVKVVAAITGPAGMALIGQLTNVSTLLQSLATGGITTGLTRYISAHAKEEGAVRQYIGTASRIVVVCSGIIALVLLLSAHYVSGWILGDSSYTMIFRMLGGTIFFFSGNALLTAILNGYQEYRAIIRIQSIGSIIGLLVSVGLALAYGLMGALIAVVLSQSLIFLVTLYSMYRTGWFSGIPFNLIFNERSATNLFGFSIMAITTALVVPISQLMVRSMITERFSTSDAGIWEGMNRISALVLQVITGSMSVYYLPRLAEAGVDAKIRVEVRQVFRFLLPVLILIVLSIYSFRHWIIRLLFTDEFSSMSILFAGQLLGDVGKVSGWILGYVMIAKAMVRTYVLTEILNYALFVYLSYVFTNLLGIQGAVIAYASGHWIYLVFMVWIFRKMLWPP